MAGKITEMTAIGALADEDLIEVVDDPSGTPLSRKATMAQLRTLVGGGAVLNTQTASSSSTLDFTSSISSAYDEYLLDIIDLIPSTNTIIDMRFSTDNGSTYESSGTDAVNGLYDVAAGYTFPGSVGAVAALNSYTRLPFRDSNTTLATDGSFCAHLRLVNLRGSKNKKVFGTITWDDNSNGILSLNWYGRLRLTTAVNALRLLPRAGNFTSGTVRLYGVNK